MSKIKINKEDEPNFLEQLGWWTCFVPVAAVMWATIGYTISMLWLWFAVPLGVKPVNNFHAVGLYLLFSVASGRLSNLRGNDTDDRMIANSIAKTLFFLLILGVAYIIKGYV